MTEFIKGMDVSTLLEEEACGARYFDNGVEGDALEILKKYGTNYVRLRLWNDPYDEQGRPYGAGTNDLEKTIILSKRAKSLGMGVLLDLHYSDFWADPGKQFVPKAWRDYSVKELENAVYEYTLHVMRSLKDADAFPTMVQIGNEITNGLLWPTGKKPNFDAIAMYVNAGIRGVREVDKDVEIMIHLDEGSNNPMYIEWFDNFIKRGGDFQIIGMSYYPFWHGTFDELSYNMKDMAERYGKKIAIAEVSTGFSMDDYRIYEVPEDIPEDEKETWLKTNLTGKATRDALVAKLKYPMTKQGQCDFMQDIMERIREVPNAIGFFYWEPAWIPVPGCGWATEASLKYIEAEGLIGNEWANQALFDYEGNVLPALKTIADF
ncbi:MAG: glycosyl hydrolase 53 family protein [Butyrivibrio sp.]|nr:glycosyl hydrolase 53 family protein [Butyrivibrio sp.]